MTYTYTPKVGDVVRFPNGVEVNYSEADQELVVLPPEGKALVTTVPPAKRTGNRMVFIGVRS